MDNTQVIYVTVKNFILTKILSSILFFSLESFSDLSSSTWRSTPSLLLLPFPSLTPLFLASFNISSFLSLLYSSSPSWPPIPSSYPSSPFLSLPFSTLILSLPSSFVSPQPLFPSLLSFPLYVLHLSSFILSIFRCRPVRSDSVAEVLLEDFLTRILSVYGGRIPHWANLDEGHSRSSKYVLDLRS